MPDPVPPATADAYFTWSQTVGITSEQGRDSKSRVFAGYIESLVCEP